MKQYIREQADILSHILEHSDFDVLSSIKNKHQITIAASGTSKNAALVVKAALAKANIQMNVEPPFSITTLFTFVRDFRFSHSNFSYR